MSFAPVNPAKSAGRPLLRMDTVPKFVQLINSCSKRSAWDMNAFAARDW